MATSAQQPSLGRESESPPPGTSNPHAAAQSRGGPHSYRPPPAGNQVDDEERGKLLGRCSLNAIFFPRVLVGGVAIAATAVQMNNRFYCERSTDIFFIVVDWFLLAWTAVQLLNPFIKSAPRGYRVGCGRLTISWGPREGEETPSLMEFLTPRKKSVLKLRFSQLVDFIFFILYIVAANVTCDYWYDVSPVKVLSLIIAGIELLVVLLTSFRPVTDTKLKFVIYVEGDGDEEPALYQIRLPEGKRTEPAAHAL